MHACIGIVGIRMSSGRRASTARPLVLSSGGKVSTTRPPINVAVMK